MLMQDKVVMVAGVGPFAQPRGLAYARRTGGAAVIPAWAALSVLS
jgi:hypothetical protein